MGRLAVILILTSGCGRLGFDGLGAGDPGGNDQVVVPPHSEARVHPAVCATNTLTVNTSDPDIALAGTPTGATVFWVPKAGGDLSGLTLDLGLQQVVAPRPIRNGTFTAVGANYIDDTLIATAVSSSRALVHIVPQDLASFNEIANVDGSFASEAALIHVAGARLTPTACSGGLNINPYTGWTSDGTVTTVATSQTTGLDSTPFGNEALSMWSTADGCHLERHTTKSTGVATHRPNETCDAPRLASDGTTAIAMYESSGTMISQMPFGADQFDTVVPFASGRSPRMVFDGASYWAGYLDPTGALVVGYFDGAGGFSSITLGDVTPKHDAFELAWIDNKLWDVSMTDTSMTAHQICLTTD